MRLGRRACFVFRSDASDPFSLPMVVAVVGMLVTVAFVATYPPARRASRIQRVQALATE